MSPQAVQTLLAFATLLTAITGFLAVLYKTDMIHKQFNSRFDELIVNAQARGHTEGMAEGIKFERDRGRDQGRAKDGGK